MGNRPRLCVELGNEISKRLKRLQDFYNRDTTCPRKQTADLSLVDGGEIEESKSGAR